LFSLGLARSDLTASKASFTTLLQSLNVNTVEVDNYVAALQAYLAVVVSTPTPTQKTTMTGQLDLFDAADTALVQSFEGLSDMGFAFNADLRNADFNGKRTQSTAAKALLRSNPEQAFGIFTNLQTAKTCQTELNLDSEKFKV
jgi:hypothetical protein